MALLTARTKMIQQEQTRDPNQSIHEITHRMVAYASKCSHSSVERACKLHKLANDAVAKNGTETHYGEDLVSFR